MMTRSAYAFLPQTGGPHALASACFKFLQMSDHVILRAKFQTRNSKVQQAGPICKATRDYRRRNSGVQVLLSPRVSFFVSIALTQRCPLLFNLVPCPYFPYMSSFDPSFP